MILAKLDDEAFLDTVRNARVIAFQRLEFGYAMAAPLVAFYAPIDHPGGGNFSPTFSDMLGQAFLKRMSDPWARTLRPTAKPVPTERLRAYLEGAFGPAPEAMSNYSKAPGDRPEVIESECQVVIQAIEENRDPNLAEAMKPAKRSMMSEVLDLVIAHAMEARDLCEAGDEKPALIKVHVLQAAAALKACLEMFLKP